MIIGYARVSTDGQTLDAQQASLRAAGAERIFSEKVSGAVTDRKAVAKAIAALSAGDILGPDAALAIFEKSWLTCALNAASSAANISSCEGI